MGLCKCFLRSIIIGVIAVLLIVLIPNLPPYADITKSFSLPQIRSLEGPLAINEKLKDTEIWHKGKLISPEAFAEYNGELYTSLHGGVIAKLVDNQIIAVGKTGKPCKFFYEEKICGRPLGLRFDENGILYVADPYYGILKFNFKKDQKDVIVSPNEIINGKKSKLFNSVAVARNGDLFWSDSSTQFHLQDIVYDVLSDPTGRLVHYDAKTKKNTVLIDNLHFANGVILSKDEDFVLVAETFYSRIHRYYLKGPKKGTHDIFVDGLPGIPDNLQSDGKDGFLAPLIEAVDEEHPTVIQILFEFPNVRKFLARIMGLGELAIETADNYYPTEFAKKAIHFIGHYRSVSGLVTHPRQTIVHLSKNGEIMESFTTTDKKLRFISDAFIFKDQLYLGSPINDYIGRIPLSKLDWEQPKVKRSVPEPKVEVKQEQPKQTTTPPPKTTASPSKQQTTPPPPKATTPPPKQQTPPPPKATTPPPKQQTPPPKATTPPPKATTPPPKATTPPPKPTTPPPKPTTPPPKQQTPPKPTTPPPKQQTPPKPTTPPPKPTTPPPKQQTPPPPKVTTPPPPPAKQQTQSSSKTTSPPSKEATGGKQKEPRAKNEL